MEGDTRRKKKLEQTCKGKEEMAATTDEQRLMR